MQSKIIVTKDKSKTLLIPELNETYHSTNGALTEALHVFQQEGIVHSKKKNLNIFEMGFGTGLNALLSYMHSIENHTLIHYDCIEAYPITKEQALQMDYLDNDTNKKAFAKMHESVNKAEITLSKTFEFRKFIAKIQDHSIETAFYDIIFYDAFGPKIQPELWETSVLSKLYTALISGGFLVTYCAQGAFKRNLKAVGFDIESIPGPPGKREMTRAYKR
jgi:tRNA U34 5-methylaminomethyl-2-thiouridine-forming methyltransferase MnmC